MAPLKKLVTRTVGRFKGRGGGNAKPTSPKSPGKGGRGFFAGAFRGGRGALGRAFRGGVGRGRAAFRGAMGRARTFAGQARGGKLPGMKRFGNWMRSPFGRGGGKGPSPAGGVEDGGVDGGPTQEGGARGKSPNFRLGSVW